MSFSACAFNDDGRLILCTETPCQTDTDPPPGQPAPGPFSFSYNDGGFQSASRLATDGVMQLRVDVRSNETAQLVAGNDAFELEVLSSIPRVMEIELAGAHAGEGTIVATLPTATVAYPMTVADVASAGISLGFGPLSDRHVVLGDIHEVAAHLLSAEGDPLVDHSLAIDPSSDAGFTQINWDVITLPETPGERVLVLSRRSGTTLSTSIRTADHVDTIVVDGLSLSSGDLCVHAELDGERVSTFAWQFTGNDKLITFESFRPDCVSFLDAKPGATITASIAGTTTEFVVLPL